MAAMSDALFTPQKRGYVPSDHARGPWDRAAMHGGPPAALMAGVMEALPTEAPMAVVRITVEIFRPVPLRPVEVAARIEREGRRVQLLSATLTDGNTELCRATAWRMRIADLDVGEQPPLEVPFELCVRVHRATSTAPSAGRSSASRAARIACVALLRRDCIVPSGIASTSADSASERPR